MTEILHSKPWITDADRLALSGLMDSGMLAQGEKTQEFERKFSEWVSVEGGGVAVGSGSAAIVLALDALGVGGGDEVVLPTYVCAKVLEAVATTGAVPVLCDIGDYWIVRPEDVEACITSRTRALVLPHLYGIFADTGLFRGFGIPVIEDFAQAIGPARHRNLFQADIAIYSFHPTKLLTTGEGGMAVSADPGVVARMRAIRDGSARRRDGRLFSPMSDMSSVLGLSQLTRYHASLERRTAIAARYRAALEDLVPGGFREYPFDRSMFFRFPIKLKGGIGKYKPLFAAKGIRISNGVDELLHRHAGLPDDRFRSAVSLFETTVSLPIYPALTGDEQERCVAAAVEILSRHAGGHA